MKKLLSVKHFEGYFNCYSEYGQYMSTCNDFSYDFKNGIYILQGDINSGGWAFSYAISSNDNKKIIINDHVELVFNGEKMNLDQIWSKSCYLSEKHTNCFVRNFQMSVKKIIEENIKEQKLDITIEEIRDMFFITPTRFDRKIYRTGNERFACRAAIGYSRGKEIFCFPWFSDVDMRYFYVHIVHLCNTLKKLGKIVILPTSCDLSKNRDFKDAEIINFMGGYESMKDICNYGQTDSEHIKFQNNIKIN